ncbi:MAG: hypothetical protein HYR60_33205 [Acidobacteria bacterium]|nr:hypothetical protein [Acidobacteriota bacterium]
MFSMHPISFDRWPDSWRLSNGDVELVIPTRIGPRVMRYGFAGEQNLFKIFPPDPANPRIRGGHRLWVAPERLETTWIDDDLPVSVEPLEDGLLRVTKPVERQTGLEKQMLVRLAPSGSTVEVIHRVRNCNPWTVEFAPWALTQMAPGGLAITGFPPRGTHPENLLPTNPLVMWAYTDFSDPRWKWTRKHLILKQDPSAAQPLKVGLFNPDTWAAYLLGSHLFLKRSTADPARAYPDFGCSFETYTNHLMLELETLGPLSRVAPGEAVEHVEHWSLRADVHLPELTDEALESLLK